MPPFLAFPTESSSVIPRLIQSLGGAERIRTDIGAIFLGIPGQFRSAGSEQLREFLTITEFQGPRVDYRLWTGEFASASAVAAGLAVQMVREGNIPAPLTDGGEDLPLRGRGILLLGLGDHVTATRIVP